MHRITPNHPSARDTLTGEILPEKGVLRAVLLPPDHYAERQGDITIAEEKQAVASPALEAAGGDSSGSRAVKK